MRAAALFTLLALLVTASPRADAVDTVIRGATVIDVLTGKTQVSDILIRDDRIVDVSRKGRKRPPAGAQVIEASGRYAIPGLWDMHLHLAAVPEMTPDRVLTLLLVNGVTSVRDTGGPLERVLALRKQGNDPASTAPRVHVAGPVIDGFPTVHQGSSTDVPGASLTAQTPQEAIQFVDQFADAGVDFIKAYEMLKPDTLAALVKRAHERHLLVTGHIPLRMTTMQALDAGLDGIEHIRGMEFDCAQDPQSLLTVRVKLMDEYSSEAGAALRRRVHASVRPEAFAHQDPKKCAALIQRFVEQGTWHTPTLHIVAFRALRFYEKPEWKEAQRYLPKALVQTWHDRLIDYTDPTHYAEWKDQGDWALAVIGEMYRAGVRLMAGTDAPGLVFMPGFTLHDELSALSRAGMPPAAVLKAATLVPAQYFHQDRDLGTIAAGKLADIVLLDANPLVNIENTRRVATVISKGRVYDRTALDALLAPFDSNVQ